MQNEEWRPAPGFEHTYSVSTAGRVRRDIDGRNGKAKAGQFLQVWRNRQGYAMVSLRDAFGRSRSCSLHRLVAEAFLGPIPDHLETNHKNGLKDDPRLPNLELVTKSENMTHAWNVLRVKHGMSKLDPERVQSIRRLQRQRGLGDADVAHLFNVSACTVWGIRTGRFWKHVPEEVTHVEPN